MPDLAKCMQNSERNCLDGLIMVLDHSFYTLVFFRSVGQVNTKQLLKGILQSMFMMKMVTLLIERYTQCCALQCMTACVLKSSHPAIA